MIFEDMNNHENRSGWICPRCGKAISPDRDTCPYCDHKFEGLEDGQSMLYS